MVFDNNEVLCYNDRIVFIHNLKLIGDNDEGNKCRLYHVETSSGHSVRIMIIVLMYR